MIWWVFPLFLETPISKSNRFFNHLPSDLQKKQLSSQSAPKKQTYKFNLKKHKNNHQEDYNYNIPPIRSVFFPISFHDRSTPKPGNWNQLKAFAPKPAKDCAKARTSRVVDP